MHQHKTDKEVKLDRVLLVAHKYKLLQDDLTSCRAQLLDELLGAKREGATQQEIADRTHFSRQRIAQFLKEAKAISHAQQESAEDSLQSV